MLTGFSHVLRFRTRDLTCGLAEPGFETRFAKSGIFAGDQRALTKFRAGVSGVLVNDDFARIFECGQAPLDEFIHAKLLRPSNFDDAIYWLTYCNPGHTTCNVVSGHRLEKHRR